MAASPLLDLRDLSLPVVAAPMAGGPTTPALVVAAARAGGFGQLAAGYLGVERLAEHIAAVRSAGVETFGVNIFAPESRAVDEAAVTAYREVLTPYAAELGVSLPDRPAAGDDGFAEKLDLMVQERVPVVSFTFGCPQPAIIDRLQKAACRVGVTVTEVAEARTAAAAGADWLCVQGPDAGGHRSVFDRAAEPSRQPLPDLLATVAAAVDLPLVAAGGITTAEQAARLREIGATAVQVGTLLLRTPEAGTRPAHAAALADPRFTETVVTRAFSGRPARGLRNAFIDRFDGVAPTEYPAVNSLTGPLRSARPEDPETLSLWAGTGYRAAREEPAAEALRRLV